MLQNIWEKGNDNLFGEQNVFNTEMEIVVTKYTSYFLIGDIILWIALFIFFHIDFYYSFVIWFLFCPRDSLNH